MTSKRRHYVIAWDAEHANRVLPELSDDVLTDLGFQIQAEIERRRAFDTEFKGYMVSLPRLAEYHACEYCCRPMAVCEC